MKPRRDITLGEMQDECKRVFGGCALCRVRKECVYNTLIQPRELDLSDPPRFNEAQMAFWSGWRNAGATRAFWSSGNDIMCIMFMKDEIPLGSATVQYDFLGLEKSGFADLAELLGKDAT